MPEAALPALGESLMAESFVAAAPEMFIPEAAMGAEFGTAAAFEGLGAMEGLGGLSALGSEFGTEALFGGLGGAAETAIPTLSEGIAQGVTSGGLGAGEAGINEAMVNAEQVQAANSGFSQAELEAMQRGQEIAQASSAAPPLEEVAGQGLKTSMMNAPAASGSAYELTGANPNIPNPAYDLSYRAPVDGLSMGGGEGIKTALKELPQTTNPLANGFNTAMDFAKNNPFSAASMAYTAKNLLGKKEEDDSGPTPYNGILSKYKISPNFQGRHANPEDYQYTPKVYAEGGIASFKSGGDAGSKLAMDYYESMQHQQNNAPAPARGPLAGGIGHDTGTYYDLDPDTRYLDPVTAAQVRMAKINKRSNVQAQNMKRPTPMGQINLSPPGAKAQESDTTTDAAHGGIMRAQRYADGGITGGGNLDLHIPLDLGGGGGGGGGLGSAATYPFQNNGGFTGYNNAAQPQVGNQPSPTLGQFQNGMRSDTTFMDDFQPKGTSAFGGNPQQGMSQLFGLLGGQSNTNGYNPNAPEDAFNAQNHFASGGITSLGGYAAGGNPRLLKGPGDGMSDNIPATIAGKQPARLADGEFVVPADVVSHLGNGSTEAGAKILHEMMNKVRQARTGNSKQGKQINPRKFVPA